MVGLHRLFRYGFITCLISLSFLFFQKAANAWIYDADPPRAFFFGAYCNPGSLTVSNGGNCTGTSVSLTFQFTDSGPVSDAISGLNSVRWNIEPATGNTGSFSVSPVSPINYQDPPAQTGTEAGQSRTVTITNTSSINNTRVRINFYVEDNAGNKMQPQVLLGNQTYFEFSFSPSCPVTSTTLLPANTCTNIDPTFTSTFASPANRQQFAVDTENPFDASWSCNSGWTTSSTYTPSSSSCSVWDYDAAGLKTNTYYWSTRADGGGTSPVACYPTSNFSILQQFKIDKDKPAVPVTPVASYNAVAKNITFTWPASTDTGCATCGGYASKYWLQGYWTNGSWVEWYENDGNVAAAPSCSATQSYGPISCVGRDGITAYFQVKTAKDSLGNESAAQTLTGSYTCPLPACPTSTVSAPADGICTNTDPTFTSSYNTPGSRQQFAVDTENPFQGAWTCNSGWMTPGWNTDNGNTHWNDYNCSLSTGTYYWSTRTDGGSGVLTCTPESNFAASRSVNVDKDLPAALVTPVASYNLTTKAITFNWTPATDVGCGTCGNYAGKYWLEGWWSDSSWYAQDGTWQPNSCSGPQFPRPTQPALTPTDSPLNCTGRDGETVYLRVRQAKDNAGTGNVGPTSLLMGSYSCPTPTLYPTIAITGAYQEDVGSGTNICKTPFSPDIAKVTIAVTPAAAPGVTATCAKGASSYSCNITFDNQGTRTVDPSQNLTINASYPGSGYNPVSLRTLNSCTGTNDNTIPIDVSSPAPTTAFNKDLFFKYENPNWFKLSTASFDSVSARDSIIPGNMVQYDVTDDTTDKYLDVKTAGSILSAGVLNIGANPGVKYSAGVWYKTPYTLSAVDPKTYLEYTKSRKGYKQISTLADLDESKVNVYNGGSLSITDATPFNNKKVVVIVTNSDLTALGTVGVSTATFAPTSAATTFIAASITFGSGVTEAQGIFIGNSVDFGTSSSPLKIKGNVISNTAAGINRTVSDNSKPSLFVVFDVAQYMNALPYLSVSTYDWRQLQ